MVTMPLAPPRRPVDRDDRPAGPARFAARAEWPTLVVSMPFMDLHYPSIQLGLLKAIGTGWGFPVRTLHANLDFAVRIGQQRYDSLAEHRGVLVGDWLFSPEAFGDSAPDRRGRLLEDFADRIIDGRESDPDIRAALLRTRQHDVPEYLDELLESVAWEQHRVVAFSSTFAQNAASFALARRLKEKYPDIVIVFGGANFDGDMGLEFVRAFDFIDYAVIGEGDLAFPRLLDALAVGSDPGSVPGVARRRDGQVRLQPSEPPFRALDELPTPDYQEYFERAEDLGVLPAGGVHPAVRIPFESSRGCWWGEKHHCTFCGLNGVGMSFRSKTAQRVLDELAEQAQRYHSFAFDAVDNIMDVVHLREMLPALVESRADYEIFYEVKANLTRDQLRLMAQAGITRIQPGLESMNSRVLTLMRKGVRAGQNINLLRWAQYYGINVSWNILWGFPGESEQDYAEQAAVLSHLVHLKPPSSAGPIWMERFSPIFSDGESFKLKSRAPERSYSYVYPDVIDLEKIAYFFDYELEAPLPQSAYSGVDQAVRAWSAAWTADELPILKYWSAPGFVQIYDGRHPGKEGTYTFTGPIAEVYLACTDRPISAGAVVDRYKIELSVAEVQIVFNEFARRGLMFVDGTLALSLGLPAVGGR